MEFFSKLSNNEEFKEEDKLLSKSILGGSMNTCKTRVMNFLRIDRVMQGSVSFLVPRIRTRLVMSEKPDGTVAWYQGDIDDGDACPFEDHLLVLPNTHIADLLAAEFKSLMMCSEGCLMEEHIQAKSNHGDAGPSNSPRGNSANDMHQYGDSAAGQASSEASKQGTTESEPINSTQNILANARMLPLANSKAMQMSQGLLSGGSMPMQPQQLHPQQQSALLSQLQKKKSTVYVYTAEFTDAESIYDYAYKSAISYHLDEPELWHAARWSDGEQAFVSSIADVTSAGGNSEKYDDGATRHGYGYGNGKHREQYCCAWSFWQPVEYGRKRDWRNWNLVIDVWSWHQ